MFLISLKTVMAHTFKMSHSFLPFLLKAGDTSQATMTRQKPNHTFLDIFFASNRYWQVKLDS